MSELACARCTVLDACLEFALELRIDVGVWGGTTPDERKQLPRTRNGPPAPKS